MPREESSIPACTVTSGSHSRAWQLLCASGWALYANVYQCIRKHRRRPQDSYSLNTKKKKKKESEQWNAMQKGCFILLLFLGPTCPRNQWPFQISPLTHHCLHSCTTRMFWPTWIAMQSSLESVIISG